MRAWCTKSTMQTMWRRLHFNLIARVQSEFSGCEVWLLLWVVLRSVRLRWSRWSDDDFPFIIML